MLSIDGAFNTVAHTVEVRRPESTSGRYNIPNIGIFLWRLEAFRLTALPLVPDPGDASGRRFRLNPLGADMQLFRAPRAEPDISHLAEPVNVPAPLTVREFALQVREATGTKDPVATSDDYGAGASVVLSRAGTDEPLRLAGAALPDDPDGQRVVRVADLRDIVDSSGTVIGWAHEHDIAAHQIGLDPERGRVLLGTDRVADNTAEAFTATFHYGFARAIGGGEYDRMPDDAGLNAAERSAGNSEALQPHLDALASTGGRLLIHDSLTYADTPTFKVAADPVGLKVVVGASTRARPLLAASSEITLDVGSRGTLVLDGIVISGGALHLPVAANNAPRTIVLRDCTLVPGRTLASDGTAVLPGQPSLIIRHPFTTVRLERCITGPLRLVADADVAIELVDCIVDAGDPEAVAYSGIAADEPGADVTLRECTVIGKVFARVVTLASNCIFVARRASADPPLVVPVRVERGQEGCLRFSFVPRGSATPRRHRCQPDADHPDVLPRFTSLRYGAPGYCQLRSTTAAVIRHGADDEGEMGVMHALFQPQRETNLQIRLEEYLRFGLHAGVFYAT
jgi:hypothetical protein